MLNGIVSIANQTINEQLTQTFTVMFLCYFFFFYFPISFFLCLKHNSLSSSLLRRTMPLPTVWLVWKGSWIPSNQHYLDQRTLPSPRPLKMPPLPLAPIHPSWKWGQAEPRWIQSWTARPWMKEKYPVTTETWRTWICLRKRQMLPQEVSHYNLRLHVDWNTSITDYFDTWESLLQCKR